ncbi:MAG: aldo/keto reductase [Acidobacteriaceae bacterium]|nr:aldo/keto reductase [Acidobacteriaceae bacterium]
MYSDEMRYVSMLADGPDVSALGMGCAAVLGRTGRRDSLAALAAAWDAGITFYDTARSYGYGESERLLGEFFIGERRQRAVLCTKFGILPAAQNWKQKIKPLAQAAVRAFPALRSVAQRQASSQLVAGKFSVEMLKTSLDTSLRTLRMEYVDMLLLHAAPISVLAQEDLLDALQRLVEAGKVRMAGISGEQEVIAASFAQCPRGLKTAQFAMNLSHMGFTEETEKAARDGWLLVANHPFGGPAGVDECRRRIEAMREDLALPTELREKLTQDAQLMPEVVLNTILSGTGVHAVIPAMMQLNHLRDNVQAVERCRFTAEELALLRAAMP